MTSNDLNNYDLSSVQTDVRKQIKLSSLGNQNRIQIMIIVRDQDEFKNCLEWLEKKL